MTRVAYLRPATVPAAVAAVANDPGAVFLGGGTNVVDLLKEGVTASSTLVDVSRLPLAAIRRTPRALSLGATATNAATAADLQVRRRFPVLSRAILAGASGQLRNMATNGGNLHQRTRCPYFYDVAAACNKRSPGAGCSALGGVDRNAAVFGWSDTCVATHPGDMAVALSVLDAKVTVVSPRATRSVPVHEVHRLPGDDASRDTTLERDELVTSIELPERAAGALSAYLKVRDRPSYAFALVSVAVALHLAADGTVSRARVALGGVAHVPWRARRTEQVLLGNRPSARLFDEAAEAEMAHARPLGGNAVKVALGRRAIARALRDASRSGT